MNMQTKLRDSIRLDGMSLLSMNSTPGERGVLLPEIEEGIQNSTKDAMAKLPSGSFRL